jgi:hypothetical protein
MALTVEDGSSVANADAFVSIADCDAYHTAKGNTAWTGDDDTVKEPAIRRATSYLNGLNWLGSRVNGRSQALSWPRKDVTDAEGNEIATDELPQEVIDACCELALRELVEANSISPDFTPSDKISREKVGDLEVEYAGTSNSVRSVTPVIPVVDSLINQFLVSGGSSTKFLNRS